MLRLTNGHFPDLDEDWFEKHGARDPKISTTELGKWIQKRQKRKITLDPEKEADHDEFLKRVLVAATGLSLQAIKWYLLGPDDPHNVQRTFPTSTIRRLDHIVNVLGDTAPDWERRQPSRGIPSIQVAVLSELESLPSLSYHTRVIRGIVCSDSQHLFLTALHEVRRYDLENTIEKILRVFSPAAFVLIRLTPSRKVIDILEKEKVPMLLVHADRCKKGYYKSPPVLINVVPDQRHITTDFIKWVREHHDLEALKKSEITVVSMKEERTSGSIRDDRINKILKALKALNLELVHVRVDGYSFEYAYQAYIRNPDAPLFCCLSDQLAVEIKHLLMATGKDSPGRVIGFDNSELAKKERIISFDQGIEDIGQAISNKLSDFFAHEPQKSAEWPHFEEKKIPVRLVTPEAKS